MHSMSTQKRRVIYMTDQEWDALLDRASRAGISASKYLRDALAGEYIGQALPDAVLKDPSFAQFRPSPKPSQAKR